MDIPPSPPASPVLPDGFRFGVATAGYQVEGGFNGPGQPRNNWYRWEREGRIEPSGIAVDFWNRYEEHLDHAVATGCDSFRLSVEWARCEPTAGTWDDDAFARYRAILAACRERGLEPLVTLHHFTHPWWLGEEFWLDLDAPERFAAWVAKAVDELGAHADQWVTLNEINILALMSYVVGSFPPGRKLRAVEAHRCCDNLLAAHVLAYEQIHDRQPHAVVATNTYTMSVYELDRALSDILLARLHDVIRGDLLPWLWERKRANFAAVVPVAGRERALNWALGRRFTLATAFPRAIRAVYESPYECTLDVTQLDYYAPALQASILKPPGHRTSGGRATQPGELLWDQHPDAQAMKAYVPGNVAPGRPLWIAENGLCNRVLDGRPLPRLDGYTRPRYLREHLATVVDLLDAGVPIGAYFHWSLVDNYEWGSYEPRFGLYGVDRTGAEPRWLDTDSLGDDSAGAYRRIIEGLRTGDRTVLAP